MEAPKLCSSLIASFGGQDFVFFLNHVMLYVCDHADFGAELAVRSDPIAPLSAIGFECDFALCRHLLMWQTCQVGTA
jgi:hypothetical protein